MKKLLKDEDYLDSILKDGNLRANEMANESLTKLKNIIGLLNNEFYLPIAEIQINLLLILFFGFLVGFMSGLFGVGGGFLMTPLLILWESHLLPPWEQSLFKYLVRLYQVPWLTV